MLRVRDVMQQDFYAAGIDDAVRDVGLTMAADRLDVVPIVDHDGKLVGVMTERALARRYIRESREASTLADAPTRVSAIAAAVSGTHVAGEDIVVSGRVWVFAMATDFLESGIGAGDAVIIGNREDAQRRMIERGVALMLLSNGVTPSDEILKYAREHGTAIVVSPLDSYVCGRMTTLAAPCSALMDAEPLTVRSNDLLEDVTEEIKNVHYRAAIAVDRRRAPDGPRHPLGPRQPDAARGAARRPRRAGPERPRRREGPHRRDPRSPSHWVDRDARARARDLRPRGLDLDAGDRAFPPGAGPADDADRDRAARGDPVGHRHPQLADDHRSRPRGGRVSWRTSSASIR